MLTIRQEQIFVLAKCSLEAFETKMLSRLRSEYPSVAASLGDDGLRKHVRSTINDAMQRGFVHASAIGMWIELRLQFGDKLERSPDRAWANRILAHPSLPDYVKLDVVRDRLTARTGGRPVVMSRTKAEE